MAVKTATTGSASSSGKDRRSQVGRYICFVYDIPSALAFPNPSPILRNFALRLNMSCWVVPLVWVNSEEFSSLLQDMQSHQEITHYYFRFDKEEREDIQKWARRALEEEKQRIHSGLLNALDDAQKAYDKALEELTSGEGEMTRYKITLGRESKMRYALRNAGELLDSAIHCAEVFDETENVKSLFDSLRKVIVSRNVSFEALVRARVEGMPEEERGRRGGSRGPHKRFLGRFTATTLLNWMGQQEWSVQQARRVLRTLGSTLSDMSISSALSNGRPGTSGEKRRLDLTQEEIAMLEGYRSQEDEA